MNGSVQSATDRAFEDFNRTQLNYRKLQISAHVTAEAMNSIILNSTNHAFRKSCYSNLQVCKTGRVTSSIQKMFINSVCCQVSNTRASDIEMDLTVVEKALPHGIQSGGSSQSNDSYEDDDITVGCSYHHLEKRRCILETSKEDSYQAEQSDQDYLSDGFVQFSYIHGRTYGDDTENLTFNESEDSEESTHQEENAWLKEVCNLAYW
ncbi:uncharacterized protein LOC134970092 [Pseudophryne corroboree]|uniref:uncharacterized protein LOC134970092 n=1 Tax=Pseudophryne corroboree TaxID=495146 RepID=UPI003081F1AC